MIKELKQLIDAKRKSVENRTADYDRVVHELAAAQNTIAELTLTIDKNKGSIAEWQHDKEELITCHQAEVAKMKDEHEKTIAELNNAIDEAKKSAANEAASILAQIGVPIRSLPNEVNYHSDRLMKQFTGLYGPEKTKFFQEHKEDILDEVDASLGRQ